MVIHWDKREFNVPEQTGHGGECWAYIKEHGLWETGHGLEYKINIESNHLNVGGCFNMTKGGGLLEVYAAKRPCSGKAG